MKRGQTHNNTSKMPWLPEYAHGCRRRPDFTWTQTDDGAAQGERGSHDEGLHGLIRLCVGETGVCVCVEAEVFGFCAKKKKPAVSFSQTEKYKAGKEERKKAVSFLDVPSGRKKKQKKRKRGRKREQPMNRRIHQWKHVPILSRPDQLVSRIKSHPHCCLTACALSV